MEAVGSVSLLRAVEGGANHPLVVSLAWSSFLLPLHALLKLRDCLTHQTFEVLDLREAEAEAEAEWTRMEQVS